MQSVGTMYCCLIEKRVEGKTMVYCNIRLIFVDSFINYDQTVCRNVRSEISAITLVSTLLSKSVEHTVSPEHIQIKLVLKFSFNLSLVLISLKQLNNKINHCHCATCAAVIFVT